MTRFVAAMAIMLASGPAWATDVVVRVSGVVGDVGWVRVGVCVPAEYAIQKCRYAHREHARTGVVMVTVPAVPPGTYAVIAHHDRVGDGVVRTDWLGIPKDGVGVSRDAEGFMGPPGFDAVALAIAGSAVAVDIALKREPTE